MDLLVHLVVQLGGSLNAVSGREGWRILNTGVFTGCPLGDMLLVTAYLKNTTALIFCPSLLTEWKRQMGPRWGSQSRKLNMPISGDTHWPHTHTGTLEVGLKCG